MQGLRIGHCFTNTRRRHIGLCRKFQGGMDEVRPFNSSERMFALGSNLLCFLLSIAIVSRLTSSMTQLHVLHSRHTRQLSILRAYLLRRNINRRLALRIERSAIDTYKAHEQETPEAHLYLLQIVSEPLRIELHYEIYSPVLSKHSYFDRYIQVYPQVIKKVCHSSVTQMDVCPGDVIFHAGELPEVPKMYMLCDGFIEYMTTLGRTEQVTLGMPITEAALWISRWMHVGGLTAVSTSRLVAVDARSFQKTVTYFDHPDPEVNPRERAQQFVSELNTLPKSKLSDLFTIVSPRSGGSILYESTASEGPLHLITAVRTGTIFQSVASRAGRIFSWSSRLWQQKTEVVDMTTIVPQGRRGESGRSSRDTQSTSSGW